MRALSNQETRKTGLTISAGLLSSGLALAKSEGITAAQAGQRLALLRKEKGITQIELAERLGVTQSMVSDYENGVMRLHTDLIHQLTAILGVSADDLLGLKPETQGTVKNRRLARRLQAIEKLSKRDQDALLRTIDAFVSKAS